jgi:cobalt-zinc-cadmium resistance protein CzcA
LAIKVVGEDLDVLLQTAEEIEAAIQGVEGAADIILEKVDGLPQMKIEYDRAKIAKYGLNVEAINQVVTMGFAGLSAGTVFEGEKQFDLVVRFDEPYRKDIEHLENAAIQLPSGGSIPLSELAKISYTKGPAKISRDNTQRRVVVGVNVRNRDLQSVVDDIQAIVKTKVTIPEGYRVDYGGQFENLQQARNCRSHRTDLDFCAVVLRFFFRSRCLYDLHSHSVFGHRRCGLALASGHAF